MKPFLRGQVNQFESKKVKMDGWMRSNDDLRSSNAAWSTIYLETLVSSLEKKTKD